VLELRALEGLSVRALAARFPTIKRGRIAKWIKGTPRAGHYPLEVRRRAWDLRAAGYTIAEIARRTGVSDAGLRAWLKHTGVARKLKPEDREPIAAALRAGESAKTLAARYGYGERSIQGWIREGRLPPRALLTKVCKACGAEYEGPTRQAGACSEHCRGALSRANRIATRWRQRGRNVTPAARELMIAQSFLRMEVTGGSNGNGQRNANG